MEYKLLSSKNLFMGKAIKVWLERVQYPEGLVAEVEVVQHPGAVTILPVDTTGQVWFVRQYRHPAGEKLLELPAGTLEPDEAPAVTAAREIREEIGMSAGELKELGSFYVSPGYSTEHMVVFLATALSPAPLNQDFDEKIEVEKYPLEQVNAMIAAGEIRDAKSIAAFFLARDKLRDLV